MHDLSEQTKKYPKAKDNLVSCDIETKCTVSGCSGKFSECDHALSPYTSIITVIGIYYLDEAGNEFSQVFRDLDNFRNYLTSNPDIRFVGHNFKFDFKHLHQKGMPIRINQYAEDTQIQSATSLSKVSPEYQRWYEDKRQVENEKFPVGYAHRAVRGGNSLKILAPYFLKVQPFWEDPMSHDNDEYVLKDCKYTYQLHQFFNTQLIKEGLDVFYNARLMKWTGMLTLAEIKGICIDRNQVCNGLESSSLEVERLNGELDKLWAPAYEQYAEILREKIRIKYSVKFQAALAKAKQPVSPEKKSQLVKRYAQMTENAMEKVPTIMNLASPKQLGWILRDYFGLDIKDFNDDDSTGKQVLNRLAASGREDIKTFLEYRKHNKLYTSFYPSYMDMANAEGENNRDSVIHTSFNPTGTRTGRLSSSSPNLQQVPSDLHSLFMARSGYKLITRDLAAIEPCLVAYYTQDPFLCDLLIRGGDFHSHNAIIMLGLDCEEKEVKEKYPTERKLAKTVGLALIYGAGPFRIQVTATQLGFNWHIGKCKEIFENFKAAYETAFDFKKSIDEYAINHPIETLYGRKHSYPDPSDIYMKAFNTLVQSTASDLLLNGAYKAAERFTKSLHIDAYPLLFVHDEIVFECIENQALNAQTIIDYHLTSQELPTPYGNIPLRVEGKISDRWEK